MPKTNVLVEFNVFSSDPGYVDRGQNVSYTAHATTVYSTDQAIEILDIIGKETDSDDVLPFAMNLVDGAGVLVSVGEDNGEFGVGEMLGKCLQELDGFNALVCVSRKVAGVFVSDMLQPMKMRVMKEVVNGALGLLYQHLVSKENENRVLEDMLRQQQQLHESKSSDIIPLKVGKEKPQGSGPNGRETIFERTNRQAMENYKKQSQIESAKRLLRKNRAILQPKVNTLGNQAVQMYENVKKEAR
jgi:hypothetical protein